VKVLITNKQKKYLIEQELIGYTPEKIDGFVQQGLKEIEHFKKQYQMYYNQMLSISIGDAFENINGLKSLLDKMKSEESASDKLSNKYYQIIEHYDHTDYPSNVEQLENIYTDLEYLSLDFRNINDIVEGIYDSIEHFINWNQKKIDRDSEHQDLIKKIRG